MLKPVIMDDFVLQEEDLADLLPDVTQSELESIAQLLTDYLMEDWWRCLNDAVAVIQGDRRTNGTN